MDGLVQSWWRTLFSDWNALRMFRLAIGIFVLVQAVSYRDGLAGAIAGIFLVQALTNTGCCGVRGCAVPKTNQKIQAINQEVEFEEIQPKTSSKSQEVPTQR